MLRSPESGGRVASRRLALGALGLSALALVLALLSSGRDAAADPPPRPAVLAGHEVVVADSGDPSLALLQTARAECPPGKGVVSGGYAFSNTGIEDFAVIDNHPSGDFTVQEPNGPPIAINNGWLVTVLRTDGQPENWAVLAYAVCVATE